MDESKMEQRRENYEGLRVVKFLCKGRTSAAGNGGSLTVPCEKATANYVPAAAVIRRWHAVSGIIGRTARAGGLLSLM